MPHWHKLGRRTPINFDHVEKYPYSIMAAADVPFDVNRVISLPWWHKSHDQAAEGSCVGHGIAMERAIVNTRQNILANVPIIGPYSRQRRYNPIHIWNTAKTLDEWDDTNPGDDNGTSVNAGYKVAKMGIQRVKAIKIIDGIVTPNVGDYRPDPTEGVAAYRWATTVDEMRYAIKVVTACTIGINWYGNFDNPIQDSFGDWWIGRGSSNLGGIRGGHCVAIYGASDKKQAFKIKNSWGVSYPQVWIPYETMQRLIDEYGEVAIVTDR